MTIRIYFISLLILLTHFAHAQSPTMRRGSYLGITGGVGTAWMAGQHNYGLENLSGTPETAYAGGVTGGVTLKGGHTIHGEVVFSFQKQRYQDVRHIPGISTREALIGKDLDFVYLRFPLMYRRVIGIKNGDTDIGDSKFFWGAGIEMAALYDAQLDYKVNGVSDERFVFIREFNDKMKNPRPPYDIDLFNPMDFAIAGSLGWERFLTQHFVFQAELKGAVSLFDINDEKLRIPNDNDIYTPSRHVILNFKCAVIYYVNKVKRLDVY